MCSYGIVSNNGIVETSTLTLTLTLILVNGVRLRNPNPNPTPPNPKVTEKYIIVGAPSGSGSAYVYERAGGPDPTSGHHTLPLAIVYYP